MKMSRRAKRMERHHEQRKRPSINLVSLMDIFTILVFFLLVSSSNVQQLPNKKEISLPTSIATKKPEETLIIFVTQHRVMVQGREVALIDQIMKNETLYIEGLEKELNFQSSKNGKKKYSDGEMQGKAITIMGDENIPYALLRKILATCRQANYTQIAFAAMQKSRVRDKS